MTAKLSLLLSSVTSKYPLGGADDDRQASVVGLIVECFSRGFLVPNRNESPIKTKKRMRRTSLLLLLSSFSFSFLL